LTELHLQVHRRAPQHIRPVGGVAGLAQEVAVDFNAGIFLIADGDVRIYRVEVLDQRSGRERIGRRMHDHGPFARRRGDHGRVA
jgi:hypothetical protein